MLFICNVFIGQHLTSSEQCKLFLLTIVQPRHLDWLTSRDNPPQYDVTSLVHAAVLQGLYEGWRIQTFTRGEVKKP